MPGKRIAQAAGLEEEEAFPRGGADILKPLEKRQLAEEARLDFEAEQYDDASGGKGKRAKGASQDAEGDFFKREEVHGKVAKFVELLKFKTLSVGMRLWGMVLEVTPRGLTISLPHGLRGHVTPNEASDVLHSLLSPTSKAGAALREQLPHGPPDLPALFYVGQFVRCSVLELRNGSSDADNQGGTGGKKKVHKQVVLSLRLKHVCGGVGGDAVVQGAALPAVVKSVEDHGFLLGFGIKGYTGFLPRKDWAAVAGPGAQLLPGALLEVVVKKAPSPKQITVTVAPDAVAGALTSEASGLSLASLLPGSLVNGRVRRVLSDGLVVSFATYFHGSIDMGHLGAPIPEPGWKGAYKEGQRVRARVVYVDPAGKRVGLSCLPHLINRRMPAPILLLGQVFEAASVARVDSALGLLMRLPMSPEAAPALDGDAAAGSFCPAFCHLSNLEDGAGEDSNAVKKFKPGQAVPARVIGFRLLDGLAVVSLKESVIRQQIMSLADVHPGQQLEAEVLSVGDAGLLVSLAPSIKALVPTLHMSELGSKKMKVKYKPGQKVVGRVLSVDPATKRVSLTLKKALLTSKLPPLADIGRATPGMKAHGVVTGVSSHGVFVQFYGGLKGLAPPGELGLAPGQSAEQGFQVGQVVRARVMDVNRLKQRLKLSLAPKGSAGGDGGAAPEAADPLGGLQPGDVVAEGGRVVSVDEAAGHVNLTVSGASGVPVPARLPLAHLADHPAAAKALATVLAPGVQLAGLLVLERLEGQKALLMTRKQSLVQAAQQLPSTFAEVQEGARLPGYVASVTGDAVFVRFLAGVTGRAGLAALADTFVSDPRRHFTAGQSVVAKVVQVDGEKQRFALSLKPSVAAPDAASQQAAAAGHLEGLFRDLEAAHSIAAAAAASGSGVDAPVDYSSVPIGGLVSGDVEGQKAYGAIFNIDACPDAVGLITSHHGGSGLAPGAKLAARVLDVVKGDGIVDLTLRPELLEHAAAATPGKKSKAAKKAAAAEVKVGQQVEAVVQLIREGQYYVVSLPGQQHTLGFLPAAAHPNAQPPASSDAGGDAAPAPPTHALRSSVQAVVAALPSGDTGGRLVLAPVAVAGGRAKAAKAGAGAESTQGLVNVTVVSVTPLGLEVTIGQKAFKAHIHVSELGGQPPSAFSAGQALQAARLAHARGLGGRRHKAVELTLRPEALEAVKQGQKHAQPQLSLETIKPGALLQGWVQDVSAEWMWISLGPALRGRVHILDAACDFDMARSFQTAFQPGQQLAVRVAAVDADKHTLDLSVRGAADAGAGKRKAAAGEQLGSVVQAGALLLGRIQSVRGAGVVVQLAPQSQGRAALTDLHDTWQPNALTGLQEGAFVRARVLDGAADAAGRVPVSLRALNGGAVDGLAAPDAAPAAKRRKGAAADGADAAPELLPDEAFSEGAVMRGYVKAAGKAGLFVVLDRKHEVRVRLSNLSDGFIEDPAAAFPEGSRVEGRLMLAGTGPPAPDGTPGAKRWELTLRSAAAAGSGRWRQLADIEEGEVTGGKVRKVEKYGVFVELERSNVSGLAHISQLSDGFVKDPAQQFKPGQAVRAKVLSVDRAAGRVSLSLKESDTGGADAEQGRGGIGTDDEEEDLDAQMVEAAELEGGSSEGEEPEASGDESDKGAGGDEQPLGMDDLDLPSEEAASSEDEEDGGSDAGAASGSDAAASDEEGSQPTSGSGDDDEAGSSGEGEEEEGGSALRGPHNLLHSGGAGPSWGGLQLDDGDGEAGDGDEAGKLTKRQKKRAKQEREAAIRAAEAARLAGDAAPTTAADYDKLVLGSPNSSFVWIKYMAFLISLGELDAARKVAERALSTIHYREEAEKFNVWVAWLNLEAAYGTPDPQEAAMALFNRALQYCDQKKLYLAMLGILERGANQEAAGQLLKAACKKFNGSCKVWLRAYEHALREGGDAKGEAGRKLLQRATSALPHRKHVKLISRAALTEFRAGDSERGRSMMEGVLSSYPKRLDLWNVYIDQETKLLKQGEPDRVRPLFERVTTLALPPKKMRFMFRRWLEHEQQHGTDASVEDVKRRAMEYVEANVTGA